MPYSVGLPNGQSVEFPDEVSHDEASSIISKQFPEFAPKPETGFAANIKRGAESALSSQQTAL